MCWRTAWGALSQSQVGVPTRQPSSNASSGNNAHAHIVGARARTSECGHSKRNIYYAVSCARPTTHLPIHPVIRHSASANKASRQIVGCIDGSGPRGACARIVRSMLRVLIAIHWKCDAALQGIRGPHVFTEPTWIDINVMFQHVSVHGLYDKWWCIGRMSLHCWIIDTEQMFDVGKMPLAAFTLYSPLRRSLGCN